jgi:uncharacterized protein (DUF302 family)
LEYQQIRQDPAEIARQVFFKELHQATVVEVFNVSVATA